MAGEVHSKAQIAINAKNGVKIMDEGLKKILLTCLFFMGIAIVLKLIFWGSFVQTVHDFYFHYANAAGNIALDEGHHDPTTFQSYPPLFKWLSFPFAFSSSAFYLYTLFFFGLIPVILLFVKTKSNYSAWFYFTASAFFWNLDYFATFAQYTAILVLMIAIIRKDALTRLILIPLAALSHNLGLVLLLSYYAVDYLLPIAEQLARKAKTRFAPLLYPIIDNKMGNIPGTSFGVNSLGAVLIFTLREYNIVYIILSFAGMVYERSLFIFSFFLLFFGAFEWRIWWVLSYIGLIGLCNYFEASNESTRKKILAFSLITLALQLYSFSVLNIRHL